MTPEQENKWREEFRIFFFKGSEFWHNSNTAISIEKYSEPYKHGVQGYIEARKKAQEEIDDPEELALLAGECGFDVSCCYDKDDTKRLFKNQVEILREEIDELKEELEGQLAKKDEIIKELWKLRQLTQYCWEKEAEIIEKKIEQLNNEN